MEIEDTHEIVQELVEYEKDDVTDAEIHTDAEIKKKSQPKEEKQKFSKLPIARVKAIMKMDPGCELVSQDSVLAVTKATELFIQLLARESLKFTLSTKRKTFLKKDVDAAIETIPQLCFLDGAME